MLSTCILSRGYGRSGARSHPEMVISRGDGQGPRVEARVAGDEPFLLARRLPEVAVVVGARRQRAGLHALQELDRVDVFVLDDAFSHVRLARDLDLLLFPARRPWGGGLLLPTGRLREPLEAAQLADALVLTGLGSVDGVDGADGCSLLDSFASATSRFAPGVPTFGSALEIRCSTGPESRDSLPASTSTSEGKARRRYLLVTGVADAVGVERSARQLGLEIVEHLDFPDHHRYPKRSLERIRAAAAGAGASVLTTEKDAVKIARPLREDQLEVDILHATARPEEAFFTWLDHRLARLGLS